VLELRVWRLCDIRMSLLLVVKISTCAGCLFVSRATLYIVSMYCVHLVAIRI
jgi:hypothetical protein